MLRSLIAILVWVAYFSIAFGDSEALLQQVREGHRQTMDRIKTMYIAGEIHTQSIGDIFPKLVGENKKDDRAILDRTFQWWQDGELIRFQAKDAYQSLNKIGDKYVPDYSGKRSEDICANSSTTIRLFNPFPEWSDHSGNRATVRKQKKEAFDYSNPWDRGLFQFQPESSVTLTEALDLKDWKRTATEVREANRDLILIEGMSPTLDRMSFRVWVDPQIGYLVRKRIIFYGASWEPRPTMYSEAVVEKFERFDLPEPLYFPVEMFETRNRVHQWGIEVIRKVTTKFSEIQFNQPIPSDRFQLSIPPNYRVYDAETQSNFTIGPDGRADLPLLGPTIAYTAEPEPTDSREEQLSQATGWVVIGLSIIAGMIFLIRGSQSKSR